MGWSDRFVDAISAPVVKPLYLLESVQIGQFAAQANDLRLSSFPTPGYTNVLVRQGSSINWGRLTPGTWRRSYSSATFAILDTFEPRDWVRKGQAVQLLVGFEGWDPGEFEPVWIGTIRSLMWSSDTVTWLLGCVDLVGSLASHFRATFGQTLYGSLGSSTLAANYTPGVSTTIQVSSGASFEESSEGGGEGYLLEITPAGTPYYVHATSKVGAVFSGTLTTGLYGTTAIFAGTGAAVRSGAYTTGKPLNIARRILASTGDGTNGGRDVLPESWGFGIPDVLINGDDIAAFSQLSAPSSGAGQWDLYEFDAVEGSGWFAGFLGPGAFFLSLHQGQITARAILDTLNLDSPSQVDLTDDDLVALDYETWTQELPIEYRYVTVTSGDSFAASRQETDIVGLPTLGTLDIELPNVWEGTSNWSSSLLDRVAPFFQRRPEAFGLTFRGWRAGVASMGDTLRLSTGLIGGRQHAVVSAEAGVRRMLIIGGGPDFFGSTTSFEVLAVPLLASE